MLPLVQLAVTFPRPAAAALGPGKLRRNAGPTRLQQKKSWRDANNGLNHARLVRPLVLLESTIYLWLVGCFRVIWARAPGDVLPSLAFSDCSGDIQGPPRTW
jgi:hypothetical protein